MGFARTLCFELKKKQLNIAVFMCEVLDVHGYLVGDLIHIFCNLVPDFVLLGAVTLLKYIFLLALI